MHPWNVWNVTELKLWGKWRVWVWLVSEFHSFLHRSSAVKVKGKPQWDEAPVMRTRGRTVFALRPEGNTLNQITNVTFVLNTDGSAARLQDSQEWKRLLLLPGLNPNEWWKRDDRWEMGRLRGQNINMSAWKKTGNIEWYRAHRREVRTEGSEGWLTKPEVSKWKSLVSAADVWQCLRLQAWPGLTGLDAYTVGFISLCCSGFSLDFFPFSKLFIFFVPVPTKSFPLNVVPPCAFLFPSTILSVCLRCSRVIQ